MIPFQPFIDRSVVNGVKKNVLAIMMIGGLFSSECTKVESSSGLKWKAGLQRASVFDFARKHAKKMCWIVNCEDDIYVYVDIGDALSFRFDKWYALRINKKNGSVFRQELNSNGDAVWIADGVEPIK